MSRKSRDVVRELLDEHGATYAESAGITLGDKPSPLYQLLVLTMLSSTRISADVAVSAARELFGAGWRTPERMRDATRATTVPWTTCSPPSPRRRAYFGERALGRAAALGLPTDPVALAELAPGGEVARLATALVRDPMRAPPNRVTR